MNITLRTFTPADAPRLAQLADNANVPRYLRDGFPHPYTLADAEAHIASTLDCDDMDKRHRAICVDGELAGSVGVFRLDNVYSRGAELGYWLGEQYWGRGVVTAAVREICADVFRETDILRIEAGVFSPNKASARVLEKCGFRLEGIHRNSVWKNGELMDCCMYALLKE